jgi:hypothetical protein
MPVAFGGVFADKRCLLDYTSFLGEEKTKTQNRKSDKWTGCEQRHAANERGSTDLANCTKRGLLTETKLLADVSRQRFDSCHAEQTDKQDGIWWPTFQKTSVQFPT